ncbi:glycosyltransferase [Alphaproteobacteria bacterium KMM 3653]|uniref:Glycosyltransferase n=1 Tax=Harenicola maris TaxID=2841044 RepID=A0AAP2CRA3_9RHOB|nr:glycosyltransferase [Harenicola maris]
MHARHLKIVPRTGALRRRKAPLPGAVATSAPLLGKMLLTEGALAPADLIKALAIQQREDALLGDILRAHNMVAPDILDAAIARQWGVQQADLVNDPPDPWLADSFGLGRALRARILPWKRAEDGTVLVAAPDRAAFTRHLPDLQDSFGPVRLVYCNEADLLQAIEQIGHNGLSRQAEYRVPLDLSCRARPVSRLSLMLWGFAALCAALLWFAPLLLFALGFGLALCTMLAGLVLKAACAWSDYKAPAPPEGDVKALPHKLPKVSVLVPLFRETHIAERLAERLKKQSYPRELLDICLVVEADDTTTQMALATTRLPDWMRIIAVPQGRLRTKPRAMNYALDFCHGSLIGVWDAEDNPAPDQIHQMVKAFHNGDDRLACVQGALDFYNARHNWISRWFTAEYATWFRLILPGLARMKLAVPLGGTTLFFRRSALEALGGWDAHNVTEDADLGIRLARAGYRTELISTTTLEECTCTPRAWVKQRSRWLKGYALTWGVHMRRPKQLYADLGPRAFFGFQMVFLSTLIQFTTAPLLWTFWLPLFSVTHPLQPWLGSAGLWALAGVFLASELASLAISGIALSRAGHRDLIKWLPGLHIYFMMGTAAMFKAWWEVMLRPFYWDKTTHGAPVVTPENAK